MSRAKRLIGMLEDGEGTNPLITSPSTYSVNTAGDPPHTHSLEIDNDGNGKLIVSNVGEPHEHNVVGFEVQSAGIFPHIHEIINSEPKCSCEEYTLEAQDKVWDDSVSDTKEKVKIQMSKNAPSVRRVFDKTGKYMGSFDTKKPQDKNKYKTMFKGAK